MGKRHDAGARAASPHCHDGTPPILQHTLYTVLSHCHSYYSSYRVLLFAPRVTPIRITHPLNRQHVHLRYLSHSTAACPTASRGTDSSIEHCPYCTHDIHILHERRHLFHIPLVAGRLQASHQLGSLPDTHHTTYHATHT
jgi:hypothetical protein